MDINSVSFTGRLTADPTTRVTQSGKTVASFTVAVAGRSKEETHFIDVSWWPAKPEHVSYFAKGNRVAISGSFRQERWQGNDGKQHSKIGVVAQSVVSMERRPDAAQGQVEPQRQGFGNQPQQQQGFGQQGQQQQFQGGGFQQGQQQPAPSAQYYAPKTPPAGNAPQHFSDEDIPF